MGNEKTSSEFDPAVLAQMASQKSQGKRPSYFSDPMAEHQYSISLALMAELAVARERIDTLERLLAEKGVLSKDEVEGYIPDDKAATARQTAQVEYSARIFRSLQQSVESMSQSELNIDEMARRLGDADPAGNDDA